MPAGFPPEVALAAVEAARRRARRRARRPHRPAVRHARPGDARPTSTRRSPSSAAGDDIVLHYAIADVGFFVRPGRRPRPGGLAARRDRLPARRAGPPVPGGAVGGRGQPAARRAPAGGRVHRARRRRRRRRASTASSGRSCAAGPSSPTTRSRADELPADFAELARRIEVAEERRGAPRVEFPEQELARVDGRWALRFAPRLASEDHNAGMSLATNLAVADALHAAGTGLFRVMADARRARRSAGCATRPRAFGLDWPADAVARRLPALAVDDDSAAAAFLLAVRRAGGGASYEPFAPGVDAVARGDGRDVRPRHGAAAPARRPLRRRGGAGRRQRPARCPTTSQAAFAELPAVMAAGEALANRVDAAVIDLAEAVLLAGRAGRGVRRRRRRRGPPRHGRSSSSTRPCWSASRPTGSIPATTSASG